MTLSERAISILKQLPKVKGELVFPGQDPRSCKTGRWNDAAPLNHVMRRVDYRTTSYAMTNSAPAGINAWRHTCVWGPAGVVLTYRHGRYGNRRNKFLRARIRFGHLTCERGLRELVTNRL